MATSPRVRAFFSFSFPSFAHALPEPLSKAAPGARRAAPSPRFRRKDRLARRLGAETWAANCDDPVTSLALLCWKLWVSDCIEYGFITWVYLGFGFLWVSGRFVLSPFPNRSDSFLFQRIFET